MIRRIFLVHFFCVAQLFFFSAHADDMSVFGFSIGQSFSLAECQKYPTIGYGFGGENICYKRYSSKTGPIDTENIMIRFPIREAPVIVKGLEIIAGIIDGKLEGISFNTAGIDDSEFVLAKLKEKYGEPKIFIPRTVKNRFGASFDAFDAIWIRQDFQVKFESVRGKLDTGLVQIDTPKNIDLRNKRMNELTTENRPL